MINPYPVVCSSSARGALIAGSLLLSGCSHWEFAGGFAVGAVLSVLAIALALGLANAIRSDFRGSIPERRTFDLSERARPRAKHRWGTPR